MKTSKPTEKTTSIAGSRPKRYASEQLSYERDRDREKVKGIFKFHEVAGGRMKFVFKQYKGDQVEHYDLVDGDIYTLPLGVAKHLNKNGWYPVHAYTMDEDNKHSVKIGRKVRRFSFQSLEFMDGYDSIEPGFNDIVTVERIR